jgi:hypothetical protein
MLRKELRYISDIGWSKRPVKLPLVFTREEVRVILSRFTGINYLKVAYKEKGTTKTQRAQRLGSDIYLCGSQAGYYFQAFVLFVSLWFPSLFSQPQIWLKYFE